MIHLLVYLVFILTVAMATGGISLSARLRSGNRQEIFSSLLYFEVFAYTFGFYGLWGQFVINGLLADKISPGAALSCVCMADAYPVFSQVNRKGIRDVVCAGISGI